MKPIKRYRLTWWLAGSPDKTRHVWFNASCKFCAAKRALALATAMALTENVNARNARWSVATVRAHMTEPEIVLTSEQCSVTTAVRHAH